MSTASPCPNPATVGTPFAGLSAFVLTPMDERGIDLPAFERLVQRLVAARVDSLGVLGSTGCAPYLTRAERAQVVRSALEVADNVPVIVGIGALRTREVLELAEDAQRAGAAGLLLPPVSYQKLSDDEVFALYQTVSRTLSVPLCVYDNPVTTHFAFSDALYVRVAELPQVRSIKIPGVPMQPGAAQQRVQQLRALLPEYVGLGLSVDACAAAGMTAGCDAWYSVLAGIFPHLAQELMRQVQSGQADAALALWEHLQPLWALYSRHGGSLRVMASAAQWLGWVSSPCLPQPLQALSGAAQDELATVLGELGLLSQN